METFFALLAICVGNSPVPGEFPTQRPVTRSFDVFFYLRLNKRLSKHWWGWWFETLSCPLWRHRNEWFVLSLVPGMAACPALAFTQTNVELLRIQTLLVHILFRPQCVWSRFATVLRGNLIAVCSMLSFNLPNLMPQMNPRGVRDLTRKCGVWEHISTRNPEPKL